MPDARRRLWGWRLAVAATVLSMLVVAAAFVAIARQTGSNADTIAAQCRRSNETRTEIRKVFLIIEAELLADPTQTAAEKTATITFFRKPIATLAARPC